MRNTEWRLVSWNVNGIRAVERKGFHDWISSRPGDIICLQETKAHPSQLSQHLLHPKEFESYWSAAVRKGYSGTAIYTKPSPLLTISDFGDERLDGEGRIILAEYEPFFLFNVYFPNGGSGADRLAYKLRFYEAFLALAQTWRKKKPIIICGDVNTAHTADDLARPKENERTSGFLPEERAWLDTLTKHGYLDTFRLFTKGNGHYSWWDMKTRARERNVGWRIDYFWVSTELQGAVKSATIESAVPGSDHCPVTLTINI
jgi:exodeoxyribonuclease-3